MPGAHLASSHHILDVMGNRRLTGVPCAFLRDRLVGNTPREYRYHFRIILDGERREEAGQHARHSVITFKVITSRTPSSIVWSVTSNVPPLGSNLPWLRS